MKKKKTLLLLMGFSTGFLNGLFASGGGMVAVPMLRALGLSEEESHATTISIILPLAIFSGYLYLSAEAFALADSLPYLPGGICGAILGAILLKKLKSVWIRRIFAAIILFSAGRLLIK